MKKQSIFVVFACFLGVILLGILGCSSGGEKKGTEENTQANEPQATAPSSTPAAPTMPAPTASHAAPAPAGRVASAAGIEWTIPETWSSQPERPMRLATYSIPAASGDSEGAECAVFYFGAGQGGDVRSNIDRWIGQFQTDSTPQESTKTVNGIEVTTVRVSGTYLSPGGPMMQSQGQREGYRLIGAIVAAPEGAVFFKTTGPAATIAAAEADIESLVDSVHK